MFDFSHLPNNASLWEFPYQGSFGAPAGISTNMPWEKPSYARFILIMAIGGGGGGSGGGVGTAGTSRSGGGGGGSGALTVALYLAKDIPSSIYVTFGTSTGQGADGDGGSAGASVRCGSYRGSAIAARYIWSDGGVGGSTINPGNGAPATTAANATMLSHALFWTSVAGRAGTFATNGLPSNTSIGTASPILGGAGGGGVLTGAPTVFNGAGFTSEIPAIMPSIDGGLASSALNASSGVRLPFVSVGGAGGGANNNGPGGRGGNGVGYGAGGGGGGAGVTGQGGRGGDGGPAYACIIAW